MSYGQRIREIRLSKEMTLRDLALSSDLETEYLGKLERGTEHPPTSPEILEAIASALEANENESAELIALAEQGVTSEREEIIPLLFRTDGNKKTSQKEIEELAEYLNEVY